MTTAVAAMRLSDRVSQLQPSSTLAVSARVRELKAAGRDVIGFGTGEPDFDTPQHICQAAIDSLSAGNTHYSPVPGTPEARQAIAQKLRDDNGIACKPEHIVINSGGKHSFFLVMHCLLDPGKRQQVIVPTPAWVSYKPIVELAGGEVVEIAGAIDNDLKITPDQLAAAINVHSTAFILNSPSNPCGTMYSPDEIRSLVEVLAAHDHVTIISDEIYEKLIYTSVEHLSPGSIAAVADRVVTLNGLSKAYAMTGWRIGYLCAPGAEGALAKAATRLQSQMTTSITSFTFPAIVEALRNGETEVQRMRDAFAKRSILIYDHVQRWPDVRCPKPTGAFYVFPDISAHFGRTTPEGSRIDSSMNFAAALLEEANVAVVPGVDFGQCAEGHVRLSFACSDQHIVEGCSRIENWLKTLS